MVEWQFWSLAACPRCDHAAEDKHHIIDQCWALDADQLWEASLNLLKDWLKAQNTHKLINGAIIQGLQAGKDNNNSNSGVL